MADSLFPGLTLPVLQGWRAPGSFDLSAACMRAEGWAMARTEAFPDAAKLKERLQELKASWRGQGSVCLDLRGLRAGAEQVMAAAREAGVAFVLHTSELNLDQEGLRRSPVPRPILSSPCLHFRGRRLREGFPRQRYRPVLLVL